MRRFREFREISFAKFAIRSEVDSLGADNTGSICGNGNHLYCGVSMTYREEFMDKRRKKLKKVCKQDVPDFLLFLIAVQFCKAYAGGTARLVFRIIKDRFRDKKELRRCRNEQIELYGDPVPPGR